ncbi:SDR family NAD(P)-dependent oxidoreductase [Aeromicrobium sp.]|uniref:SDR family NAD(P)-dependent oxidoreductase n=1 Tax=Aeromicrobium sp. TaxID=1871063 RepID=UPI002FC606E0
MEIKGQVALVTGGASGLGLATARRLAAAGAKVVALDLPSAKGSLLGEEVGGAITFVPADVTDEDQVLAAVERGGQLGNLSIVVNCAGIGEAARIVGRHGPHPLDAFRRTLEINLVGTFNIMRLAASHMIENKSGGAERGVIINTASVAAYEGQVGQAAYAASKGGIVGLTLPAARDLAQHRIRVLSIAPGLFMTPMFESLPADVISSLGDQTPHPKRLGDPDEFAMLVEHIVANPMLNGETIRLDGAVRVALG